MCRCLYHALKSILLHIHPSVFQLSSGTVAVGELQMTTTSGLMLDPVRSNAENISDSFSILITVIAVSWHVSSLSFVLMSVGWLSVATVGTVLRMNYSYERRRK